MFLSWEWDKAFLDKDLNSLWPLPHRSVQAKEEDYFKVCDGLWVGTGVLVPMLCLGEEDF